MSRNFAGNESTGLEKQTAKASSLENFSFKDVMKFKSLPFQDQLEAFEMVRKARTDSKRNFYRRKVLSKMDREVIVENPFTKKPRKMLMFGSNSYLNLTKRMDVIEFVKQTISEFGVGVGGPPLLNGNTSLHRELENKLSEFKGVEDTLLFSSGFLANQGWVQALVNENDQIFIDELNHASLFSGLRLAGPEKHFFAHNDVNDLETKLKKCGDSKKNKWIVVEGVYSMDGDIAPLPEIVKTAKKYNCFLAVDDAHGTGVLGEKGKGTCEYFNVAPEDIDIHLGTLSKAFGITGGFISGKRKIINMLRYMSKSHMFSASLSIANVAAALKMLEIIENSNDMRLKLIENSKLMVSELLKRGIKTASQSGIVPVIIPKNFDIFRIALFLQEKGIFINTVEHPVVPIDQQRIRISIMASHTEDDIRKVADALAEAYQIEITENNG